MAIGFRRLVALGGAAAMLGAATPPPAPVPAPAPADAAPAVPAAADFDAEAEMAAAAFIQPFDLDVTRRMSVPVTIGGQGPFSFLVDTGAERTIIARELADRLALADGAKLRLATIGRATTVRSFQVASLELAALRLDPFEAPAFAGRHIGAAGLLGVDILADSRVLVDFRRETMAISPSRKRIRPIIHDDGAIVVTARNIAGRLILSDARIEGQRVYVIVDTGAQTSVGNPALRRLVARRHANRFDFFPTLLDAVSGEAVPAERTAIRRIEIEKLTVTDLPVSFADSHAFRALGLQDRPALLLGMDSLRLFDRVEIDFPNRRVIFQLPDGASRDTGRRLAATQTRVPG